ncbi:60S ribosomal protein L17 [Entamoeba marina]
MVKYSVKPTNVAKTSLARGDDLKVHFKNTFETARAIKGMKVARAETFLKNVLIKKSFPSVFIMVVWPVKSAKYLLVLLKNAVSNAKARGLNTNLMYVSHTAVQQARSARRRLYRAHVQKPKQGSKQHRKISTARKLTHLLL